MQGEDLEKWQKLCQVAVEEHDHLRLMELIREIDRMLLEKELRLQSTSRSMARTILQSPDHGAFLGLIAQRDCWI